ncbi:ergothioneine biosynthesis protein EgtB [Pseudomarimonas arenosa]|uniref:Ergothioneine biosynthesis protein EgtB n=1 Tax=Pseudomarimonas arenosa TaxID=2774145 RepID=A0AAW3ZLW0_9GAMM|nr:ergothioneine biosynthesis protein EgtB [Pseudomarimonas arenosa]MBD8527115.1 ergothioneine biosynthesis protein EgtB [Pseudomarimonas arenosa]
MTTGLASAQDGIDINERFQQVRKQSLSLVEPLSAEDCALQSMPEASPAKWHLGHTTWFFEQFVLRRYQPDRPWYAEGWDYLFNSYYQSVGPMHARPRRGVLSRPALAEVLAYRQRIEAEVSDLIADRPQDIELSRLITLGLQHEQQHQELLLTDIQHLLWCNPLQPAYRSRPVEPVAGAKGGNELDFVARSEGFAEIGNEGIEFGFDNEFPRHRDWLPAHALGNRLITNGEYRQFIQEGGYRSAALWLSDGWATVQREGWDRPLYWAKDLASSFTLLGEIELDDAAPVCHISFFEADAFARWAGARLPTEQEWEVAAAAQPVRGNFRQRGSLRPLPHQPVRGAVGQLYGDCWEWTASPYVGYPGFKPLAGSLGEYNGKFMCGQWVLRGGSCVSPEDHLRASYRNFFYPADRWQFMGLRLAKDLP